MHGTGRMSVPIWPVCRSRFWHWPSFNFSTFRFSTSTAQLSGFCGKIVLSCSSGNYIATQNLSFLCGTIKSSQKRGKHLPAAILLILELVIVLWNIKECWLVYKALYLGFLALFYFDYEKDRQPHSQTDIFNPIQVTQSFVISFSCSISVASKLYIAT